MAEPRNPLPPFQPPVRGDKRSNAGHTKPNMGLSFALRQWVEAHPGTHHAADIAAALERTGVKVHATEHTSKTDAVSKSMRTLRDPKAAHHLSGVEKVPGRRSMWTYTPPDMKPKLRGIVLTDPSANPPVRLAAAAASSLTLIGSDIDGNPLYRDPGDGTVYRALLEEVV